MVIHVDWSFEKRLIFFLIKIGPYQILANNKPAFSYVLGGSKKTQSPPSHAKSLNNIIDLLRLLKYLLLIRKVFLLTHDNIWVNIWMNIVRIYLLVTELWDSNQAVLLYSFKEGVLIQKTVIGLKTLFYIGFYPDNLLTPFQTPFLKDSPCIIKMLSSTPQKNKALFF